MKIFITLLFLCCVVMQTMGQKNKTNRQQRLKDYSDYIYEPNVFVDKKTTTLVDVDSLHPHLYESISTDERDSLRILIHKKKQLIVGDSVLQSDYYYLYKPYLDRLTYEDPHFRIGLLAQRVKNGMKDKKFHAIPLNLLIIGDTVIVENSLDALFRKGDRIISIGDVSIMEYLDYSYRDRYTAASLLQQYYHTSFFPEYRIEIERKGMRMYIDTEGIPLKSVYRVEGSDWQQQVFADYNAGYININDFYPNNSLLIKTLASFIKKVQKAGCKNVIIDVRKNMGGYGHNFDELISLFTDRDSIPYLAGQKIRVSSVTLKDYDFLKEDMKGQLVDMPDENVNKVIPLIPKKYLGKMNYYVLISRNTGSIAASFANILQYNGLAKLVGEPLMHNALKYGEVTVVQPTRNVLKAYSTVMMDEYTKSPDRQVYPDIPIPFIASEYMRGGDPVLEKLLEYIKNE